MTISASGNVGIGVVNPTIPLQMIADTTATAV